MLLYKVLIIQPRFDMFPLQASVDLLGKFAERLAGTNFQRSFNFLMLNQILQILAKMACKTSSTQL